MNLGRKRGIVLIIALGLVLLFVITAASFMFISNTEIKMVRKQNDSTKAFYLAEAGLHRARYDLGEDANWTDGDINGTTYTQGANPNDNFYLLEYSSAEFIVQLKGVSGSTDEIWVKSRGVYNNAVRTVLARVKAIGSFGGIPITSAIEAEGDITTSGASTVTGDTRCDINTSIDLAVTTGADTISVVDTTDFIATDTVVIDSGTGQEETGKIASIDGTTNNITLENGISYDHTIGVSVDRILSFEDVFGMDEAEMEQIAQDYSSDYTKYYDSDNPFPNNGEATGLTWISAPGTESQITQDGWTGDGVLIVEGDLKITGGTFNGVIWVIGALSISGNPDIFGGIFTQGGITMDTTITGTAEITFSAGDVDDAFDALGAIPSILDWQEVPG